MKFIILPIEDARTIFQEDELNSLRKSVDGTEVIVHEEILIEKRKQLGFSTLPNEEGDIEWTYPNYQYNTDEFNSLLQGEKWTPKIDII